MLITCFLGYVDSFEGGVTVINKYNSTSWDHPWPEHIHWLDPYLNLSSFPQEIIDAIVLGDKLAREILNQTLYDYGYMISFRTDSDLADAHYKKYYANSTENMLVCAPWFPILLSKVPEHMTKLDLAYCFNYTLGMLDWRNRKGQWKYMWTTFKYKMTSMFVLAGAVCITGVFGE